MPSTRDIIQEIADIRARQHGHWMFALPWRLFELEKSFRQHDKSKSELTRYFPVALIACIEGYFRTAIQDVVDSGEPYLSNVESLTKSMKVDFPILRAIHGKSITVGEFIAHSLQLSRLEHVDSAVSGLLGKRFLTELGSTIDRWAVEVKGQPSMPILECPEQVFKDVARTFELRHIICHELGAAHELDHDEVERCLKSCVLFLRAAGECISQTLEPNGPLTQTDMNIAAGETLEAETEKLSAMIGELRSRLSPDQIAAFDAAQDQWQRFCDAWAHFVAGDPATGGTIWPVIYANSKTASTHQRIEELNAYKLDWDSKFGEDR